jgi:hypothetical protein
MDGDLMDLEMTTYPEHEKLKAIADKSQEIYDFIDWLGWSHGIALYDTATDRGVTTSLKFLLAKFYDIDLARIEDEKRAMLDDLRALNDA